MLKGLSSEIHVLRKVVTLLLNCFGEFFPLWDVPLNDPNNKGDAQHRGENKIHMSMRL